MKKRKKVTAMRGDVVAIPLVDGSYGFAQVADWGRHDMRLIVYAARSPSADAPRDLGQPLSSLELTNETVDDGAWPIVDQRECAFDAPTCPEGVSHGAPAAAHLLDIFHGLGVLAGVESIDFTYSPMLLSGVDPKVLDRGLARAIADGRGIRGRRVELTNGPDAQIAAQSSTAGPAELRVTIRYAGEAMPSDEDLRLRRELQRRLQEFGDVSDAGAGEGRLDVWLQVADGSRIVARTQAILRQLGVADRSEVDLRPLVQ